MLDDLLLDHCFFLIASNLRKFIVSQLITTSRENLGHSPRTTGKIDPLLYWENLLGNIQACRDGAFPRRQKVIREKVNCTDWLTFDRRIVRDTSKHWYCDLTLLIFVQYPYLCFLPINTLAIIEFHIVNTSSSSPGPSRLDTTARLILHRFARHFEQQRLVQTPLRRWLVGCFKLCGQSPHHGPPFPSRVACNQSPTFPTSTHITECKVQLYPSQRMHFADIAVP